MPRTSTDLYSASVNPPRQAKRLRSDSLQTNSCPSLSPTISPVLKGLSKPSKFTGPSPSSAMLVNTPTELPATGKRRGRKASAGSRSAREAQRKMNHSIIEKARRTKINDALATLRVLVPVQSKRDGDDGDDDDYMSEDEKGKKGEEKEFKLDVLVRTVSFLQDLTERVKLLERGCCPNCDGKPGGARHKRKRAVEEEEEPLDDEGIVKRRREDGFISDVEPKSVSIITERNVRLPSISSWLPHPTVDPSLMPSDKLPKIDTSRRIDRHMSEQLPSPPPSTQFGPSAMAHIPPALALPSPREESAIEVPTTSSYHYSAGIVSSYSRSSSIVCSPLLSPTRTAEDESAASMLLQISSSPKYKSQMSEERQEEGSRRQREKELDMSRLSLQPLTPSAMLGLRR